MKFTINIEMEKPHTCFECDFSKKEYCWATCHFLNKTTEDGDPIPRECPLKRKNQDKIYNYIDKL